LRLIFYVSHGVEVARAVRGKKGDVVLRLPNGKIALPLDFQPQEGRRTWSRWWRRGSATQG